MIEKKRVAGLQKTFHRFASAIGIDKD